MTRIILTGPTASGKGKVAAALARRLDGEIVSVDSMKVFRRMDVGTAKPAAALRAEIPFHLIDLIEPWEDYSVGRFLPAALETIGEIESRGRPAILQGGTALYLRALMDGFFEGPEADWKLRAVLRDEIEARGLEALHAELARLDPELAAKVHPNDERRIVRALEVVRATGKPMSEHWRESALRLEPGSYRLFGIEWPRQTLYERIDARVLRMVDAGLFEEARSLLELPSPPSRCASRCIGYREIFESIGSGEPEASVVERIQRDTRRFAKQQLTWFRRFPMEWLEPDRPERLAERILATVGRNSE